MKKLVFRLGTVAFLFSLFIISCKKSNDPVSPATGAAPKLLLDSVVETMDDSRISYTFDFNPDSTLKSVVSLTGTYSTGYFYTYNSQKWDKAFYSNTGNIKDTSLSRICLYNADNLLYKAHTGDLNFRDSVIYNNDKQPVRRYEYFNGTLYSADTLSWSGKNLVKYINSVYNPDGGQYPTTWTFKYDDKMNAYACANVNAQFDVTKQHLLSANNVTEMIKSTTAKTATYTFTYKYNDRNYPVEATMNVVTATKNYQIIKQFVYKK